MMSEPLDHILNHIDFFMQVDPPLFENELNSSKPLYFIHPHNKFWEVSLDAQNVTYRAGKMKKNAEISSEKLEKRYSSDFVAKRTVKQKIREKLVKGYIFFQGQKPEQSHENANQKTKSKQSHHKQVQKPPYKAPQKAPKSSPEQEAARKKQQKQQKKKLKNVMQQLEQRSKLNATILSIQKCDQNEPILLEGSYESIKQEKGPRQANKNETTYLVNRKNGEAIEYELMENNKIKITKYLSEENCGFQIKSFGSNEETMKFLFGEREWLKSQGYEESQKPVFTETKNVDKSKQKPTQSKVLSDDKNKKKPKSGSLVARTDECLAPLPKIQHYNNDPPNNKEEPRLGPPSSGIHIKMMLAETWKETDPKGWFISEKLDGVRCFWTGTQMYSRNGNKFVFPNFFVKNWPKTQLDGELFNGRRKFKHTISCVKRLHPDNHLWVNVRFLVFDAPGLQCPFKERYKIMKEVIQKTDNPYIKCHFHRECKGLKDMMNELDEVNKQEGEGIMLRDPNSFYQFKRSKALMKVKTFHDDEATIVGYNEGTGKFVGHIGSLKCVNSLGAHFDVGSGLNDEMRYNPPKIGERIVYKYQELNKETGRPRFPTFERMVEDENTTRAESTMAWVREGQDDE